MHANEHLSAALINLRPISSHVPHLYRSMFEAALQEIEQARTELLTPSAIGATAYRKKMAAFASWPDD